MSGEGATESFEYMLLEGGDPDHLRSVVSSSSQSNPRIDPSVLKLQHRIGRGPFGDVWIATHHQITEDYERYHEVAVKMLIPIKDDQIQACLTRFDELFCKCLGLKNVCFLHGVVLQNGRVCIAMKYYEGSVGDKMARIKGGTLSLSDVIRYGVDLAQGMLELHQRGILVLNLKPCNFLLDEQDRAIIGDIGVPLLLHRLSLTRSDLAQRLGTPNYMAPEQWEPSIRGPISFETDSWGFGCSIVEMLSGIQPWHGRSPDEIYQLVTIKKEKPKIPNGLPPKLENILNGCFEYDLRDRPLMTDILNAFKSCEGDTDNLILEKSRNISYSNWAILKDHLQVGDTVRSRKPKNSCKQENMEIPEGTIVGKTDADEDAFLLVKVHGVVNPLRVHSSLLERVSHGFTAGDWVRIMEEDKKRSSVGILHSIDRRGMVTIGVIGIDTLWNGHCSDLQIAETLCVGQFVKLKVTVSSPRFEWPCNQGGAWATGRICEVLPNGCLVVKFPGRFSFGEPASSLADPSQVEVVSFKTCEGAVKKYQHLEDFHWAVRPSAISLGLLAALNAGLFISKSIAKPRKTKAAEKDRSSNQGQQEEKHDTKSSSNSNPTWFPPAVANILFKEGFHVDLSCLEVALQPTDHLDRDPHVASLLLLDDGNRSIAALFGDDGAAASSGSPASAAEDSPTSSSMNWDGLARRALRGRERWAYCHSSSLPAASSSGDEEASSAGGGAGDRVADPWWRFAGTSGRTQTLALKLDYDEILVAWSDRGPLYIEGDSPQEVPWHNGACGKPYYAFPVMVEVGPNEAWRMPEIMDGAAAAAALDSRTTAEGEEERSRKEKVRRYKEKRRSRLFAKRIRYEVRKQNAEKRPRFKGRFVKQESW